MDAGLANKGGAGWIVKTQRDRGLFYQNFTLSSNNTGTILTLALNYGSRSEIVDSARSIVHGMLAEVGHTRNLPSLPVVDGDAHPAEFDFRLPGEPETLEQEIDSSR